MFGIGGFELVIILIFAFLIFGPDKLPEIGRTIGRAIAKFREAQQDMNEALDGEKLFDPNNPDEPFKDPMVALDKLAQHQEEKRKTKESGSATASASKASAAKPGGAEAADKSEEPTAPRKESFTERKARYERERAARKAAEAKAAEEAAKAEEVAKAEEAAPVAAAETAPASATEGGDE